MPNECLFTNNRKRCILTDTDYGYKEFLLLTEDQIRLIEYFLENNLLDPSFYTFTVFEEDVFEKI